MLSPTTPQPSIIHQATSACPPPRALSTFTICLAIAFALLAATDTNANNFNLRPSSQNHEPNSTTPPSPRNPLPVSQPRASNSRTRLNHHEPSQPITNPTHSEIQAPQAWVTPPQPFTPLPNSTSSQPISTPSSPSTPRDNHYQGTSSSPTPPSQQASFRTTLPNSPAADSTSNSTSTTDPNPSGLILKPRSDKSLASPPSPKNSRSSLLSILASLGIVIGLFLFLAWAMKRSSSQHAPNLPKEVIQVLGRTQIAPRQLLYVLRFGSRLVLVTQQAGQTTTLSEIEDPLEVDRIAGLCEQNAPNSISNSFREVFQQVASNASPSRRRRDSLS